MVIALHARAADAAVDQGKLYFDAGVEAYEEGQYPAAIQAFEQAYRIAPHSAIDFSIAQAYRRQYFIDKNPELARRALARYRSYLDQVPQGRRRADAAQALGELEVELGHATSVSGAALPLKTRVMVTSSRGKDVRIALDGASPVAAPLIVETKPGCA